VRATVARVRARLRPEIMVPLLAAYFAFAAYYVWQAWRRETPAIFTDELEFTQISRAIAHTGSPARREEAYHFTSLYPYFTAPAWWLHGTQQAFDAVKYLGVLAMTAAIFPAYALGRFVLSRNWAIAAAIGAIAAPALSYSPILTEESFAYPLSTLALWAIVRATLRPGRRTIALAFAICVVAAATRSELVVTFVVLAGSLGAVAWRRDRLRNWRATWNRWDRIGAAAFALGGVILLDAFLSHRSFEWYVITSFYKERLWQYGTWATGALAIGVGVLPLIGLLVVLVRRRGDAPDPGRTAFTIVATASLVAFCWYAALKGAYISYSFSSLVVERNLIYLAPLLFVGTALLLERRTVRTGWAVAVGIFTGYLVARVPIKLAFDHYPYYEAHGLAIVSFANRIFHWPSGPILTTLLALTAVWTLLALVLRRIPAHGRAAGALIAATCAALVVWNVTAQTYAANGEYQLSHSFARSFVHPFDWVDRATGGGRTVLVGQQFGSDYNPYNLTEFWNRSIVKVWTVDPTSPAPTPGHGLNPDLARPDGTLTPSPGTTFALAVNGVTLQAPVVPISPAVPGTTLYRLDGKPLRLAFSQTGVESDGWVTAPDPKSPANSAYNRFDAASLGPGFAVVGLDRIAWAGTDVPGHVVVRLGTLVVGPDRQPAIGRVLAVKHLTIHSCINPPKLLCSTKLLFKNPGRPFRIEVSIFPTFSPHLIDTRSSEVRNLGARVSYSFVGT
jgi:hypothetical protein